MLELNSVLQNRYRIIRKLGQGGMGAVYVAIDERVKCTVVLKRTLFDQVDLLQAFEREARLLANLRHPALPKVSDHFTEGDGHYLVMEYIPGQDLAQLLQALGRPFSPTEVLRWADELLRVLEYLHKYNPPILHRDIKPANLKLTDSGEIYLLDFGLAKGAAGQMSTVGHLVKSVPGYTPSYAPLEQVLRSDNQHPDRHWVEVLSQINSVEVERILSTPTDERSDLYSLGATLYHLLTNEAPTQVGRRAMYVWKDEPDPVRLVTELNPLVPEEVAGVIKSAMELSPERRPPSAVAMRSALRDASQSLRLHTGQLGMHQVSPQLLESILREALNQARTAFTPQLDNLNAELSRMNDVLAKLRVKMQQELISHSVEDEMIKEQVEKLESHLLQLKTELDKTNSTWINDRGAIEKAAVQVSREIAREVIPDLADRLIKEWLTEEAPKLKTSVQQVPVDGGEQETATQAKTSPPKASATTATLLPYGQDVKLPVEVSEEERRFHNDARRFARLLAAEIKLYNEQKIKEGRSGGNLYDRLRDEIDRSRQMYDKRVHPSVSPRFDYFHQELVNTLADGDADKMGPSYPGPMLVTK